MKEKKKILICPIDWGLGHATRCIPIVRELLRRECDVRVASNGGALTLLKREFPNLTFYEITGYRPFYQTSGSLAMALVFQIHKFRKTIYNEHNEIERIVKKDGIDAVISDNRFGCWSGVVPSIFVTHQLNIKVPTGLAWITNIINHRYIKKFTACWVPDVEGALSLSGELGANPGLKVTYIGPLSRFHKMEAKKENEILAIVSGPEPQRSLFEAVIREQINKSGRRALLIHGLPQLSERTVNGPVEEVSHLNSLELNRAIEGAGIVVSRPGYSTVMDLAILGKRAIFVPTPGQPEQEYLGRELMKKKIALCVPQSKFDLENALTESKRYTGFAAQGSNDLLLRAVDNLLK